MILNTVLRAVGLLTRMPAEKDSLYFCFPPSVSNRIPVNNPPANDSAPDQPGENAVPQSPTVPSMAALPKIVKFEALARCGDEIWIENEGQIYRLRKTRQGKLILTK
jgi:hemin uptake protein HemP